MDMPVRRVNYSLLNQFPDDQVVLGHQSSHDSNSGGKRKGKPDRGLDWDTVGDFRCNRIGTVVTPSTGLQRQSSGSSFGESSLSGDYYAPTISGVAANEFDETDDSFKLGCDGELRVKQVEGSSSAKRSWAQQTEESYQLQLALALRLTSDATCANDPHFLDTVPDESLLRPGSAEAMSHRFWVNGCLSYFDKIADGFYFIHGMNPYVWSVCTDLQESGRIPSIESLKSMEPSSDSSMEVIFIDRRSDPSLKELQNRALSISGNCTTTKDVVDQIAKLVCNRMGGVAVDQEQNLASLWNECSNDLKDCFRSIVFPIGSLSVGLCRHRALLFKILADAINLPCRIAKGCQYCTSDDSSSCLVRFEVDREYLVDLIGKPGSLCDPNSLLNGPSSICISSPLRFPRSSPLESETDFRSLAKQYFKDSQLLNLVFDDPSGGALITDDGIRESIFPKLLDKGGEHIDSDNISKTAAMSTSEGDSQLLKLRNIGQDPLLQRHMQPAGHNQQLLALSKPNTDFSLDVDDLDIPWSDLVLKERIGAGSFGTVHRADWHGSDVAVKILMEQDFHPERFKEFLREVSIMKRLRHPNIVLLMGAVTQPPNLSIVTEYLSRGSLYRLLHKPGAREVLDEKRRLTMAFDVAKGMNYLHRRNPPIVHRDLKSPNLLVDKKFTVKVCDFGLSRPKANTFLSSKTAAGTPEWMAPEVLRDEQSDEKSDVYSFGVILWELTTMQKPWSNLNSAQVVAAVGFKGKRPEIPREVNPQVAAIIEACWANEPWKRPSFSSVMDLLLPLTKGPVSQPSHADT
uniref:non-specific serine/threonine protein kinase n=2 Tax=Kalanchoe fedtschenkoi TaxID=63787 RepID=A0A7N0UBB2_KALFE